MSTDFYTEIEARFAVWAEGRADILAALVAGSRARPDHPADAYSVLGIMMYTTTSGHVWARRAGSGSWVPC